MTKYVNYYQKPVKTLKERLEPHPIWRGIGLILAVVLPVMSYFIVSYLINHTNEYPWFAIPKELVFPQIWDPFVLIKVIYTLVLALLLFIVISLVTFLISGLVGIKPEN